MNVLKIAGYCRISVDDELDKDNTSIENQKSIIADYVSKIFPTAQIDFYVDRDRSGYTFEQRENYQILRKKMFQKEYNILIVKDFSRFSRRTSRGLVELEDLKDIGMRIISIGDNIDYPTSDDWMSIQFRFLVNELPVTDTSKKIKRVIENRQAKGEWICAVPYGYVMTNTKKMTFEIDEPSAEIVRKIFKLYAEGWGFKRIANHLTSLNIPTPRKVEEMRRESNGQDYVPRAKAMWSLVTVGDILGNDFYIGTLRQGKYHRAKINGNDVKTEQSKQIVIQNHHAPIIDKNLFDRVQEQLKMRSSTKTHYRGIKKYANTYTSYLFCGDCGSPMFSYNRNGRCNYRCGVYHKAGLKGCTAHNIRSDTIDDLLKSFIVKVKDNSQSMLATLQKVIDNEKVSGFSKSTNNTVDSLKAKIETLKTEMKALSLQHVKNVTKHPEREELLEEVYQEQMSDISRQIDGLTNQIELMLNEQKNLSQIKKTAVTVMNVFDSILSKQSLSKADVGFIVERIDVYEGYINIQLKADIDYLLKTSEVLDSENLKVLTIPNISEDNSENFNLGTKEMSISPELTLTHIEKGLWYNRKDRIFSVNVIREGDPLQTTLTLSALQNFTINITSVSPYYKLMMALTSIADRIEEQP